jgi:O-antigen/teichoic acid export membrane protein
LLWAADDQQAAGLMLQRLPNPAHAGEGSAAQWQAVWEEASLFMGTVQGPELLATPITTLLPLVFGEPWREAGRAMQLICLVAVALHFNVLLPAALGAAGHPGQALAWSAVQLLVGVPAVAAGAAYGILGLVAANIARAYLLLPLGFGLLWRSTGIGIGAVAGGVLRPLAAAVLMAGLVAAILAALTPVLPPWAVLFCGVTTGAVSYAALVLLLMQRELREHRGALPSWLQRRLGARFDHSR